MKIVFVIHDVIFYWSLSDDKFPQVSKTLLSILTNLNNAVVSTVSTHHIIFKSSSPCTDPLVTVPRALITIGIILTLMFHGFLIPLQGPGTYSSVCILLILLSDQLRQQSPQSCNFSSLFFFFVDYTGLQRNWGKHKNTRFYLIWGCWIQIWNPFLLITSSFFLDMHSVHFVHIRYIKVYMNSGLILILWDLLLIFLVIMH